MNGSKYGDWDAITWSSGPSLYLTVFQGRRLTGTLELRNRQQQEAAINYQQVVLRAWHKVDDALTEYAAEKQHHTFLQAAANWNNIALRIARDRYRQGASDFISVLTVQKNLLQAQSALVDSTAQTAINRVRLSKALGGAVHRHVVKGAVDPKRVQPAQH